MKGVERDRDREREGKVSLRWHAREREQEEKLGRKPRNGPPLMPERPRSKAASHLTFANSSDRQFELSVGLLEGKEEVLICPIREQFADHVQLVRVL